MQFTPKPKILSHFFLHFLHLHQSFNSLQKKMTLIADLFIEDKKRR